MRRTSTSRVSTNHSRTCTGLRIHGYLTSVDGEPVHVLSGTPCECAKGAWLKRRGLQAVEEAIGKAARLRGPSWTTPAQLAQKHPGASRLPMQSIDVPWGRRIMAAGHDVGRL